MLKLLKIFWLFIFIQIAFANCPDLIPFPNLNLTEFSGKWRVHAILHAFEFDPEHYSCLHVNLSSRDWLTEPVPVELAQHADDVIEGWEFKSESTYSVQNLLIPARWTGYELGVMNYSVTFLHTDYEYAIWVNCAQLRFSSSPKLNQLISVNFLGRNFGTFPQSMTEFYLGILEWYNITGTVFYNIQQSEAFCSNHTTV